MVLLTFALSVTGTYCLHFLAGKTEGAECIGCWTPFVNQHMCADDLSTAIMWAVPHNKLVTVFIKKEQSQVVASQRQHVIMVELLCM